LDAWSDSFLGAFSPKHRSKDALILAVSKLLSQLAGEEPRNSPKLLRWSSARVRTFALNWPLSSSCLNLNGTPLSSKPFSVKELTDHTWLVKGITFAWL
jgi:hypothetical protein